MDLSVDQKCNLLVQTKKQYVNETQKLVAFMDARNRLEGLKCEILGTFDTMPQLKKLVTRLRKEGKYKDERHYVLRLSWSSTFALVTIAREGGKP
jgi:ribonuclease I